MAVRPAAVAGSFYPASAKILSAEVAALLRAAPTDSSSSALPKAVLVPHAGYQYSGPVAAAAYALIGRGAGVYQRVVLLGPVHRVPVRGLALPDADRFETPLGQVSVDLSSTAAVAELPQVVVSALVHAAEHSLEVQLPFLQTVLGEFRLVPLAVGDASASEVAEVLDRLWGGPETLIVISSDLSHYLPYAQAVAVDTATVQTLLELGPVTHEQACGGTPVNGFLLAARRHRLRALLLDQRNSGDTSGDRSRVVGYAAVAFFEEHGHDR